MRFNADKCMFPNCSNTEYARGLCAACYSSARRLVLTNRTSWEKLERDGKVKLGRKGKSTHKVGWFLNGNRILPPRHK